MDESNILTIIEDNIKISTIIIVYSMFSSSSLSISLYI